MSRRLDTHDVVAKVAYVDSELEEIARELRTSTARENACTQMCLRLHEMREQLQRGENFQSEDFTLLQTLLETNPVLLETEFVTKRVNELLVRATESLRRVCIEVDIKRDCQRQLQQYRATLTGSTDVSVSSSA